jgi:hypothetical protein
MRPLLIIGCVALVAVLASCVQQVAPIISQQPVGDITSYFWWNGEPAMSFVDTSGTTNYGMLNFTNNANGLLQVTDLTLPVLQCIVNEDSIYASGFTHGSVMDLEDGSYFSALDTEMFVSQPPQAIVTSDYPSSLIVVGTDSGIYFSISGVPFQKGGLQSDHITALAINPNSANPVIYAGTASGGIFYASPPLSSTSWIPYSNPPVNGPIGQLVWLSDSKLAASVAGNSGFWISQNPGGPWSQPSYLSNKQITALGKFQTSLDTFLLVGTADGSVGAHPLNPAKTDLTPFSIGNADTVFCFSIGQTSYPAAGTVMGIYQWTGPGTNKWTQPMELSQYTPVRSLDLKNSTVIFLSNGSVYIDTLGAARVHTLPKPTRPPQQVGLNSGYTWVLTDTNYETISPVSASYTSVSGFPHGYWPYVPGGLVLMRNTMLAGDSSWRAGTLVTKDHQSFRITGRVLAHLDSLQIRDSLPTSLKSFADDLVIRYSHEHPFENPLDDTIPYYWIVYYAKNKGPVMFDNVRASGTGASQRTSVDRRQIGP